MDHLLSREIVDESHNQIPKVVSSFYWNKIRHNILVTFLKLKQTPEREFFVILLL